MQWSGVEWPGVPILGEEQDLCTHTTPIHTRQTVGHQLLRLLDRVVLTYSGTGSQPGGVDALLNHFARNDEGTIRSVLPGEHAPADRNRLGSVNAANVPNFERDDGLRRLCAIPTGGARYRQADEREIGTGILRFTDYLFAFAVPVGSAFRAGDVIAPLLMDLPGPPPLQQGRAGRRSIEVLDQNDLVALLVIDDFVDELFRDKHPEAAHAHSRPLADFEVLERRLIGVGNRGVLERRAREPRSGVFHVVDQRTVAANARDADPLVRIEFATVLYGVEEHFAKRHGDVAALLRIEVVLQLLEKMLQAFGCRDVTADFKSEELGLGRQDPNSIVPAQFGDGALHHVPDRGGVKGPAEIAECLLLDRLDHIGITGDRVDDDDLHAGLGFADGSH